MDGIHPSPGPAPAGSATPKRIWRLSSTGATCLTVASIVLLLLYLTARFLWQYNKDTAAASAARAAAASSSSRPDPQPRRGGAALSLLPVVVHVGPEAAAAECAVCLEEFAEVEAGRALPRCGHGFHEACIATWLRVNTTCPLCRAPVAGKEQEQV